MIREITKEVGRFKVGNKPDYPLGVWRDIARSAGMPLEKFSKEVPFEVAGKVYQSPLKGTARPRVRAA